MSNWSDTVGGVNRRYLCDFMMDAGPFLEERRTFGGRAGNTSEQGGDTRRKLRWFSRQYLPSPVLCGENSALDWCLHPSCGNQKVSLNPPHPTQGECDTSKSDRLRSDRSAENGVLPAASGCEPQIPNHRESTGEPLEPRKAPASPEARTYRGRSGRMSNVRRRVGRGTPTTRRGQSVLSKDAVLVSPSFPSARDSALSTRYSIS